MLTPVCGAISSQALLRKTHDAVTGGSSIGRFLIALPISICLCGLGRNISGIGRLFYNDNRFITRWERGSTSSLGSGRNKCSWSKSAWRCSGIGCLFDRVFLDQSLGVGRHIRRADFYSRLNNRRADFYSRRFNYWRADFYSRRFNNRLELPCQPRSDKAEG